MKTIRKMTGLFLLLALILCAAASIAEPFTSQEGARFGMMPADIRKIERARDNPLKSTYFSDSSYQLYYETDIHFNSLSCMRMEYDFALNDQKLFQIYYVSRGGEPDYLYAKALLTKQYGQPITDPEDVNKYSYVYDWRGKGIDLVEAVHWVPENKKDPGIDLWYNDSDTVFIVFYDTTNPASYNEYPNNWSEWPVDELPDTTASETPEDVIIDTGNDTVMNSTTEDVIFDGGNDKIVGGPTEDVILEERNDTVVNEPTSCEDHNNDPVLSLFPEIRWGMTMEEVLDRYSKEDFNIRSGGSSTLTVMTKVCLADAVILLMFEDNRLDKIMMSATEINDSLFQLKMITEYGSPVRTTMMNAILGQHGGIQEDPDGDTFAWQTDSSLILYTEGGHAEYWSLVH